MNLDSQLMFNKMFSKTFKFMWWCGKIL